MKIHFKPFLFFYFCFFCLGLCKTREDNELCIGRLIGFLGLRCFLVFTNNFGKSVYQLTLSNTIFKTRYLVVVLFFTFRPRTQSQRVFQDKTRVLLTGGLLVYL